MLPTDYTVELAQPGLYTIGIGIIIIIINRHYIRISCIAIYRIIYPDSVDGGCLKNKLISTYLQYALELLLLLIIYVYLKRISSETLKI